MIKLTVFEAFFITHLVMDWIFQWKWEALGKSKKLLPLFFHCTVYTAGFIPAFIFFKVGFVWLLPIFLSHIILDNRKSEVWLVERFKGTKPGDITESMTNILFIGVDQTIHLAVLALVIILS